MRFSRKGTGIDQEKANREMACALERGVNYFDTAYIYPGSEVCLGKFLQAYQCRDKVYIATKLPQYYLKKPGDVQKYFEEQLTRLQTDHVDYYLMHMLNDPATWERLKDLGIQEWIQEKKKRGQIRNIGFSFHGGSKKFIELVDAWDWDFCQIQYNYMDEHTQAGVEGLRYAHAKGLPVIIMEPLRGGRLVNQLPQDAKHIFANASVQRSFAEWGLRWLWNQEEVTVVLSGMNSIDQVEQNTSVASDAVAGMLTEEDKAMFQSVRESINRSIRVPCTGCGYCMPCPHGVDIPTCFASYNLRYTDSWYSGMKSYFMCTAMRKDKTMASLCKKCGQCEKKCPQGIAIRKELAQVADHMESPIFKIGCRVAGLIQKY